MLEPDPACNALLFRAVIRLFDELGIDVDAAPAQTGVHPRRRQGNQTVTRPEVDHDVVVAESGQLEHTFDAFRRAWQEERESFLPLRQRHCKERHDDCEGERTFGHPIVICALGGGSCLILLLQLSPET